MLTKHVYQSGHSEPLEMAAVEIFRQVWLQNFYCAAGQVHLRAQDSQPRSAQRLCSPYDLEACFSSKCEILWTGYKLNLTEAYNVETRASTEPDHLSTSLVHERLSQQKLLPAEHYLDLG